MRNEAVHNNNSVSGRPAGWLKKVRLETFFSFFAKKKKKKKSGKKKKIAAARLASILATRWTGKRLFFYGQPETYDKLIYYICENTFILYVNYPTYHEVGHADGP